MMSTSRATGIHPATDGEKEAFAYKFFTNINLRTIGNLETLKKAREQTDGKRNSVVFLGDLMIEYLPQVSLIFDIQYGSKEKKHGFYEIDRTATIQVDPGITYIADYDRTFAMVDMPNVVGHVLRFSTNYIIGKGANLRRSSVHFAMTNLKTGRYTYETGEIKVTFDALEVDYTAAKQFFQNVEPL